MNSNYGLLINKDDILLQRNYFSEMCNLIGVKVKHRSPRPDKHYTIYSEIESNYFEPEDLLCIFDEHPNQKTMHKLGWNSELVDQAPIISVPFDLKGIQKGSLFMLPSAYCEDDFRLFRVDEISSIMMYPASLTCRLVPEYQNEHSQSLSDYKKSSFNLLNRED